MSLWKRSLTISGDTRILGSLTQRLLYGTNPLEYRTKEQLVGAATGGGGGRGNKGRRRGPNKSELRKFKTIKLGEGKRGERWGGLSASLGGTRKSITDYDWLNRKELGLKQEADLPTDQRINNSVLFSVLEGNKTVQRSLSDMYWGQKGWTSGSMNGMYVGCPELPDGTPVTDFSSYIMELKYVTQMTRDGRKRSASALVVVGNKKGAVGFALGKASVPKAAIRKAKNRALNYLQYIPRYQDYTVYHNIKVKYCRTNLMLERRIQGTGLTCHRIVASICHLAGIKDVRAKIVGSTNPMNIVRATMMALTSQETLQSLADKSGKFVVECRRENYYHPLVVALPKSQDTEELQSKLSAMQII